MSQYLMSFVKQNLLGKSDAYLSLLWCMYKENQDKGRYSDHIKSYLTTMTDELLNVDYQRMAVRVKRVLDKKPELNWVAPSGLNAFSTLQVKNFRGFGELNGGDEGTFIRFGKKKNIFYAPNGGGKSSLCEALELATTGHIKEADRRKTRIKEYISRGGMKNSLVLMDEQKQIVSRSLNWSSCFIDRNRLQEFSLLGSKDTRSAEGDVIASLFGLEGFQEVLSRFVKPESFKLGHYLKPEPTEKIAEMQRAIAGFMEQRRDIALRISDLNILVCQNLDLVPDQQNAVRGKFRRLQKLADIKVRKAERLRQSKTPATISEKRVFRTAGIVQRLLDRKSLIDAVLVEKAESVNYQALYVAIQAVEDIGGNKVCPACLTSLSEVSKNPFENARNELQSLDDLRKLKASKKRNETRIVQVASKIASSISDINRNSFLGINCEIALGEIKLAIEKFQDSTERRETASQVIRLFLRLIERDGDEIVRYIACCHQACKDVAESESQALRLERQVESIKEKLDLLMARFSEKRTLQEQFSLAGENIKSCFIQHEDLKGGNVDNTRFNSFVSQLESEYGRLYDDLLDYKVSLERARIAGIEGKAAEYYKDINRHDDGHEQIDSLFFEKARDGYRIKIVDNIGEHFDAFSVLSEGHLRALGLSLLLAMAEKNQFPLIVFDDVVNAIDSEHRSNIIDLFFSDPYLGNIQMIVTTHDRLFWERFCIISERHPQCDQYFSFVLSYTNRGVILIDHAGGFQEKIYRALNVYDIRQALIYCRIWFESIVVEYCLKNKISITAKFSKHQLKRDNYLTISLESTFALVEPELAYDSSNFDLIKSDLINWSGQNQEHHAFDEGNLNFVHSKTSMEVVKIYDAIRLLECQLFPEEKKESCTRLLQDINTKIPRYASTIDKLDRAPDNVKKQHQDRLTALHQRAKEINQELSYIETCLASTERGSYA
ncbi:hypothetical protein BTW08_11520 [Salinicola sp. MH3R3-1]|uniref:AAA family ATPase n=1 Tax=Salinicola sp. MH3R3-1 TaxID=1928762 RepID=UPI00094EEF33|nr:AAA family ATPase [Salinicola sp. MH3R3-1]OLO07404.1 hypothetical protein BTW08_11520 [Salinicola sp. MH3R3-1]